MGQKTYFTTTFIVFAVIGVLHLLRILNGWDAEIGGWVVPFWMSWPAILLFGYLSFSAYRLANR